MTRRFLKRITAGVAMLVFGVVSAQADIRLPKLFADHMVLQREMPVRIWGWAERGDTVIVEFAGQKKTAQAWDDGAWQVVLTPMTVSTNGRTLTVQSTIANR